MWLLELLDMMILMESSVLTGSPLSLSFGWGTFFRSQGLRRLFPFFFLLLRVTCVHSLLFSSGVASMAAVVLVVVSLVVSSVVSVVGVVLVELLLLFISATPFCHPIVGKCLCIHHLFADRILFWNVPFVENCALCR